MAMIQPYGEAYSLNEPLSAIPNIPIIANRVPNTNDKYQIGTLWIHQATNIPYILTSIVNNQAQWDEVNNTEGSDLTLEGNTGGKVYPLNGNIFLQGDGFTFSTAGTPSTSTLTLTADNPFVTTITGNSGGAVSSSDGAITFEGDGTTATVVGDPSSNTLTISLIESQTSNLIQTQNVPKNAQVTSLTFSTGISTTYDNYMLVYSDFNVPGLSSDILLMQFSTSSGPVSTGYTNTVNGAFTTGFALSAVTNDNYDNFSCTCYFYNMTSGSNLPLCSVEGMHWDRISVDTFSGSSVSTTGGSSITFTVFTALGSDFSGNFSLYSLQK